MTTTILTAMSVAFATYLVTKLLDRVILTPRLKITHHPKFSHRDTGLGQRPPFRFTCSLRLAVENMSIYAAKGCRVFLTGLRYNCTGKPPVELIDESVPLPWSSESNVGGIVLSKGVRSYFKVATADAELWEESKDGKRERTDTWSPGVVSKVNLHVLSAGKPEVPEKALKADVYYNLTFVATAENAEPYTFRCRLHYALNETGLEFVVTDIAGEQVSALHKFIEVVNADV
jgi:hypothetical protein